MKTMPNNESKRFGLLLVACMVTFGLSRSFAEEGERNWEKKEKKREITMDFPKSVAGFKGVVCGKVEEINPARGTLMLKVSWLGKLTGNRARFPEDLKRRTLKVACKGDKSSSRYMPSKVQVKYLKLLEKGTRVELMLKHWQDDLFRIEDLSGGQRRSVAKGERNRWGEGWGDDWHHRHRERMEEEREGRDRREEEGRDRMRKEYEERNREMEDRRERDEGEGDKREHDRREEGERGEGEGHDVAFGEEKKERRENDFDD